MNSEKSGKIVATHETMLVRGKREEEIEEEEEAIIHETSL